MGKVVSITIITKPEQLDKLDTGPYHILLGPNLRISKNKKIKVLKKERWIFIKVIILLKSKKLKFSY